MTHYNLDRMRFQPGPPATFLPEETPQGAEWWATNRETQSGLDIIAFLTEARAQLTAINAKHMAAA